MDDQPIASARKLLLVATTGATRNTGQKFAEDGQTLAEWGFGPVLLEPLTGEVTLRGLADAKAVRAHALTPEGRRSGSVIEAARKGNQWSIALGEPATTWWQIQVER